MTHAAHPATRFPRILLLALCLVLCGALMQPTPAQANAFFIQEMSADGMAQGNAVVAAGSKPSNMFQNAANLVYLDGLWLEATATVYIPVGSFENVKGERTDLPSTPILVPAFFASYKINDWVAVGFGTFVDFGLSIAWPEDWEGRHLVTSAGMNSFTLNPNVAFGPFKGFSVAAGFNAKWGAVEIKRALTLGTSPLGDESAQNRVHLGGDAWGFGGNLGVMYQPVWWVRMGAQYRSAIHMNLSGGRADFDTSTPFAGQFQDQRFDAAITLPHLFAVGVRFWPLRTLSLEVDAWYTGWSSYDELEFKFKPGLKLGPGENAYAPAQVEKKNFRDAPQIRFGIEWKAHEFVDLRAGFNFDGGVIPDETLDPMLPDNHRLNTSVGIGLNYAGAFLDLAYMLVYTLPRDVRNVPENPLPGKYNWMVHDVSISVGYHHDFLGGKAAPTDAPLENMGEQLPAAAPEEPLQEG